MTEITKREPLTLAAGDTIAFTRQLSKYLASDGWSLEYEGRGGTGTIIDWNSAANADGQSHDIEVAATETILYAPGNYTLEGFAKNAQTGARVQFYYDEFVVTPNIDDAKGDVEIKTHAQRVLEKIEAVIEGRASHDLLQSTIGGTVIGRLSPEQLTDLRDKYLREVENQQEKKNVKNGRGSRKKIRLRLNVLSPGGGVNIIGQFGAGSNQ